MDVVAKTEKRRTYCRRRVESVNEDDGRSHGIRAVALYCQYDARGVRSNRRFSAAAAAAAAAAAFAAKVKSIVGAKSVIFNNIVRLQKKKKKDILLYQSGFVSGPRILNSVQSVFFPRFKLSCRPFRNFPPS